MDSEFEEFFLLCKDITSSKAEMRKILQPLRAHLLKQQLKKFLKIFAILATICSAIYFVDTLNWYFCAFGRLLLIKMLPVWNWQRLRRSECIIQKAEISSKPKMYSHVLSEVECRVCEHFSNYHETFSIKNFLIIKSFFRNDWRLGEHKLQSHVRQVSGSRTSSHCGRRH